MKNTSKPPYLLGLLCLIPLVGVFVGIALILYGLIKYKDKLLVIIGAAGIIFTICVYALLFRELKQGKSIAQGFAEISQHQLDNLAMQIEYYKSRKGVYPDSLEELRGLGLSAPITDPLLLKNMDRTIKPNYYYRKINEKYTLFSVGIDGKPGTGDDLYPTIPEADSAKFGFVKVRP